MFFHQLLTICYAWCPFHLSLSLIFPQKFQKRYFVLDKQQLKYYEKPTVSHYKMLRQLSQFDLNEIIVCVFTSDIFMSVFLQDPFPLGEVPLGTNAQGFGITDIVPKHLSDQQYVFMLKVPSRSGGGFPLMAETEQSKKQWMEALQASINGTPLLYMQSGGTKDFVLDNEDDSP